MNNNDLPPASEQRYLQRLVRQFAPTRVAQQLSDECVRCSVASLFGLPREEVPHFFQEGKGSWYHPFSSWLEKRGMRADIWHHTLTPHDDDGPADWYLGYGDSGGNGSVGHMVVLHRGQVWHDPSGCGVTRWNAWVTVTEQPNKPTEPRAEEVTHD